MVGLRYTESQPELEVQTSERERKLKEAGGSPKDRSYKNTNEYQKSSTEQKAKIDKTGQRNEKALEGERNAGDSKDKAAIRRVKTTILVTLKGRARDSNPTAVLGK